MNGELCDGLLEAALLGLEHYARQKLTNKNLDMIAANQVANAQISGEDIGFNSEYNALDVYWQDGHQHLSKASKTIIAKQLIELVEQQYQNTKES